MKYPVFIELGDEATAHGIRIPDLDVSTAGDTIEEAYVAAVEAAEVEMQNFVAMGQAVPMPSAIEAHLHKPEFKGHSIGYIDIDITPYLGTTEKINVTLPSQLITSIDEFVKTHKVKSRSTFLAEAAKEKLAHL